MNATEQRPPAALALEPSGKRVAWTPQVWSAVLAGVWFCFWGLLLQPADPKASAAPPAKAPRVAFLPGPAARGGGAPHADLRALWSPVLFSLPTPMGFSRSVVSGDSALRPPLQQAQSTPVLLARPALPPNAPLISVPADVLAGRAAAEPLVPETAVFARTAAVTGQAWQILLHDGLADASWQAQPLPKVPADGSAGTWEAEAQLELSREGLVQHVWLEAPTASSNVNAQLVHALLQWRCAPATNARAVHVLLRAASAAPPPPAAGGAP